VVSDLNEAMEGARVKPLWVHFRDLGSREPNRMEPPEHWRWEDLQPVIDLASSEVSMDDAERRVLIMANPAFAPAIQTTGNLIGALQILEPGEDAHEHRHTMSAIRMILEADGGYTSVDGEQFMMERGDLILTPGWTWHAHSNTTDSRVVWFDGLDVPFVRGSLDAAFLEPNPPSGFHAIAGDFADRWRWAGTGLAAAGESGAPTPYSPRIHYPWSSTSAMLDRLQPSADGHVLLRYVHAETGEAIMPTLDCYMQRLNGKRPTARKRATSNAICVVLDGEGRSQIGDKMVEWKKNDTFTIPHWTWAEHRSHGDRAHLFIMTDAEIFRRLHLLREEVAAAD
jgi:gentisate 1,2-dioxygenase